jgi:hypothetical protein
MDTLPPREEIPVANGWWNITVDQMNQFVDWKPAEQTIPKPFRAEYLRLLFERCQGLDKQIVCLNGKSPSEHAQHLHFLYTHWLPESKHTCVLLQWKVHRSNSINVYTFTKGLHMKDWELYAKEVSTII